ncbi:hypothetical protein DHC50_13690 [Arenibacter sp. A80]|nr:hypothetical protein [Arenibacter sp. A80]RFT55729.1 hypothetical protein D0S24_13685 [Arenibacter sp. P308M17]
MANPKKNCVFGLQIQSYDVLPFILLLIVQGLRDGFNAGLRTGLFLFLIISVGILYYGKDILKLIK